jgi:hypothetical protein
VRTWSIVQPEDLYLFTWQRSETDSRRGRAEPVHLHLAAWHYGSLVHVDLTDLSPFLQRYCSVVLMASLVFTKKMKYTTELSNGVQEPQLQALEVIIGRRNHHQHRGSLLPGLEGGADAACCRARWKTATTKDPQLPPRP